jgi:hypothetical protein
MRLPRYRRVILTLRSTEAPGVEFIAENGGEGGARLRKATAK